MQTVEPFFNLEIIKSLNTDELEVFIDACYEAQVPQEQLNLLETIYALKNENNFEINDKLDTILLTINSRRPGDPIKQEYLKIAARCMDDLTGS